MSPSLTTTGFSIPTFSIPTYSIPTLSVPHGGTVSLYCPASPIIGAYLISAGLGTEVADQGDWSVFKNHLPDRQGDSNKAICIYDVGDLIHGKWMRSTGTLTREGIQVRCRAVDYTDAQIKLMNIAAALDDISGSSATWSTFTFTIHNVSITTGAVPLERDEKRREHIVQNFLTTMSIS